MYVTTPFPAAATAAATTARKKGLVHLDRLSSAAFVSTSRCSPPACPTARRIGRAYWSWSRVTDCARLGCAATSQPGDLCRKASERSPPVGDIRGTVGIECVVLTVAGSPGSMSRRPKEPAAILLVAARDGLRIASLSAQGTGDRMHGLAAVANANDPSERPSATPASSFSPL
jgi:hypothetical protein